MVEYGRNRIECAIRAMSYQAYDNIKEIKEEVLAWQENRNDKKNKIDWQFTTSDARIKLKKLYPSIYV